MRYAVSVLAIIFMLVSFSACSMKQTFILEDFQKNVSFEMTGMTVRGNLSYKSDESITFTITEPENIAGTVFSSDEISLSDVKIRFGKMGDYSPVRALLNAVSDISSKEILLPLEGEYEYTPDESTADYKIIFDCKSKEIISVKASKYIFKFE